MISLEPSEPKVTIVIVNWNKKRDVLTLLDSLTYLSYKNIDIIVVDNASTDGSVEAIRAHSLEVILLVNETNLGGTGGFNTGIHYALRSMRQDYIWLLDNDAEVTAETLSELVRTLQEDDTIGIAGSCIMSPEDRELVVEAGGFVDWRSGIWKPNLRYVRSDDLQDLSIVDVDYVAACSALVRGTVMRAIGGMDERFFLHWDDIDFGLTVRGLGYRVVSVIKSKAYHGVEKGFNPNILYYDFRNSLIVASDHLRGIGRILAFRKICSHCCTSLLYFCVLGKWSWARLIFSAMRDFVSRRFGISPFRVSATEHEGEIIVTECASFKERLMKVIVFVNGSYTEAIETVNRLRNLAPKAKITLAVSRDRAAIFHALPVDDVITFDTFKDSILAKFKTSIRVLSGGFQIGISSSVSCTLPFAFLVHEHFVFDTERDCFYISDRSLRTSWKIITALAIGEIAALVCLPIVSLVGIGFSKRASR